MCFWIYGMFVWYSRCGHPSRIWNLILKFILLPPTSTYTIHLIRKYDLCSAKALFCDQVSILCGFYRNNLEYVFRVICRPSDRNSFWKHLSSWLWFPSFFFFFNNELGSKSILHHVTSSSFTVGINYLQDHERSSDV